MTNHPTTQQPPPAPGQAPRQGAPEAAPAPSTVTAAGRHGTPQAPPSPQQQADRPGPVRKSHSADRPTAPKQSQSRPCDSDAETATPAARRISSPGEHTTPTAGPLRRLFLALLAAIMLVPTVQLPADAYTHSYYGSNVNAPNLYYFTNTSGNPLKGRLVMYYNPIEGRLPSGNVLGRYRISAQGGSGNGWTTDECDADDGPLPVGYYGRGDGDELSQFTFEYKTTDSDVIRGWVWRLGSKRCHPTGLKRFGLFIHSQGASGWRNDYSTEGCIKINQVDRAFMATEYLRAWSNGNGRLRVNP